jgi:hypothetical protein
MYYHFQTKRLERLIYNLLNEIPMTPEQQKVLDTLKEKFDEESN